MATTTSRPEHERSDPRCLFKDEWERRWFIEEWLLGDEPTHPMPVDLQEQRPGLGPIFVRVAEDEFFFDPFAEPLILAEFLFLTPDELEAKQEAAHAWAKETAGRNILPLVLVYTLTGDTRDFATLELPERPEPIPTPITTGTRFRYHGSAYPLPARGIVLSTNGEFEIIEVIDDEDSVRWYQVRNLADGELLFLTGIQLLGATFILQRRPEYETSSCQP